MTTRRCPRHARARMLLPLLCAVQLLAAACVPAGGAAQRPIPPADAGLLHPDRVAALPEPERSAWMRYLAASDARAAADRRAMEAELRSVGRSEPTLAPKGPNEILTDQMTPEWFRGEQGRRVADIILSFQTPSGGWSKRVDLQTRPRQPGEHFSSEKGYTGTFDNNATTDHIRFLLEAYRAHGDPRYQAALLKGVDYVLAAQFPNGCWPQVYPLQGSYHDAATFNDDATARILRLLRDLAGGEDDAVPAEVRQRAAEGMRRGVQCVVDAQVVVDGRRTVWGAQHDPLTLQPVKARAYEHASLSGGESADLLDLLMGVPNPGPEVVEAVHAAADWFRATAIRGLHYEPKGGLVPRQGAGPIWARFYEIGTNRPIFSNRDGVVLYRWEELEDERRYGYSWYRDSAAKVLRKYDERWSRQHPR